MNTVRTVATPRAESGVLRVLTFGVLVGSYVINAMDRQLFPLVAPDVRREYAFSLAGIGLLSTVFTLGRDGSASFVERSFDAAGTMTGETAHAFSLAVPAHQRA